jgi:hypothetical protein
LAAIRPTPAGWSSGSAIYSIGLCTGDTPVGWDAGAARLWQKRQRPPDLIFAAMATEPVVNAGSGEPIRGHLQHPMDFVRQRIAVLVPKMMATD